MKNQKSQSNNIDTKSGIVAILIIMLIGLAVVIWINSMGALKSTSSNQENAVSIAVNNCLSSATDTFNKEWPDGETKNLNDGHRINMNYLNSQIDCFSSHNQAGIYNNDINRIQDRKSDELSSYQTQSSAASESRSNRATCITSAIGSTAYTNCY